MSHYTGAPGLVRNTIHTLFSLLDSAIYTLIVQIYKLFFAVSTSTIIDGDIARAFYQRVQLILGIFMIFKLAMSLLNLIINPDSIKDKNTGTSKILVRIIITLLMLTAIVPLNIPGAEPRTLNGYINDHGILFGALYAVQDRVLSENVIAKLLLGYQTTDVTDSSEVPDTSLGSSFEGMGQLLSTTILKSFILVNVKDDTIASNDPCNGDTNCPNAYCPAELRDSGYGEEGATVATITDVVNLKCGDHYAFHYLIGISTVVGVVVAILLLGYTIDVAIRAIKLVILRIIAPIPIISFVDPKSSKDGAFASWVKTLMSTYIDLFVRLAIIYFGIFIIASLIQNGISGIRIGNGASGLLRAMTLVFIIIGLLFFMKQAPNFIKTMLGTKGVGFGPGVSGALGFAGGFLAGGGLSGAMAGAATAANATNDAQAQGKAGPGALSVGRDMVAQIRTGDPKATGGILNNTRDRLVRGAGIRMARRYGVTADSVNAAKSEMFRTADEADKAKNLYDRFSKDPNSLTEAEMQSIANRFEDVSYDQATHTLVGASPTSLDNVQQALQNEMYTAQSNAGKAKSNYDKANKFADSHRISTSFEEEHRPSMRERMEQVGSNLIDTVDPRGGPRAYAARRTQRRAQNRGEHQSVGQRIAGQNTWSPGVANGEGQNRYHDEPDRNRDSI